MNYNYLELSKMIDHSLLNPTLSDDDLIQGIQLAKAYDTASVCIFPSRLPMAVEMLKGSSVLPGTTVGFPQGLNTTKAKLFEAEELMELGAAELDMVANISQILSGEFNEIHREIEQLVKLTHSKEIKLKVIFENCYLNEHQKIRMCEICSAVEVDWVKTSTGYGTGGAIDEDLILMRKHSKETIQVKAAGGVRTLDRLLEVKNLGCSRAGATATKIILDEARIRLGLSPISFQTADNSDSAY